MINETVVLVSLKNKTNDYCGYCCYKTNKITILPSVMYHPKLKNAISHFMEEYLSTEIHELLHVLVHDWRIKGANKEKKIAFIERKIMCALWESQRNVLLKDLRLLWIDCLLPDTVFRSTEKKSRLERNNRMKNLVSSKSQQLLLNSACVDDNEFSENQK